MLQDPGRKTDDSIDNNGKANGEEEKENGDDK